MSYNDPRDSLPQGDYTGHSAILESQTSDAHPLLDPYASILSQPSGPSATSHGYPEIRGFADPEFWAGMNRELREGDLRANSNQGRFPNQPTIQTLPDQQGLDNQQESQGPLVPTSQDRTQNSNIIDENAGSKKRPFELSRVPIPYPPFVGVRTDLYCYLCLRSLGKDSDKSHLKLNANDTEHVLLEDIIGFVDDQVDDFAHEKFPQLEQGQSNKSKAKNFLEGHHFHKISIYWQITFVNHYHLEHTVSLEPRPTKPNRAEKKRSKERIDLIKDFLRNNQLTVSYTDAEAAFDETHRSATGHAPELALVKGMKYGCTIYGCYMVGIELEERRYYQHQANVHQFLSITPSDQDLHWNVAAIDELQLMQHYQRRMYYLMNDYYEKYDAMDNYNRQMYGIGVLESTNNGWLRCKVRYCSATFEYFGVDGKKLEAHNQEAHPHACTVKACTGDERGRYKVAFKDQHMLRDHTYWCHGKGGKTPNVKGLQLPDFVCPVYSCDLPFTDLKALQEHYTAMHEHACQLPECRSQLSDPYHTRGKGLEAKRLIRWSISSFLTRTLLAQHHLKVHHQDSLGDAKYYCNALGCSMVGVKMTVELRRTHFETHMRCVECVAGSFVGISERKTNQHVHTEIKSTREFLPYSLKARTAHMKKLVPPKVPASAASKVNNPPEPSTKSKVPKNGRATEADRRRRRKRNRDD